jgi:phosphatidylinositol-3-phosphatase
MKYSLQKTFVRLAFALVLALLVLGGVAAPSARVSAAASVPAFDHIFEIVMENHGNGQIIGNTAEAPYINSLAGQYGLAANYYSVAHPSLPNYLALTGGDTFVTSDCTSCFQNAPNVADRIEAGGRTWKAYMEDMPAACAFGDSYPYIQHHNPFVYYDDIRTNTARCAAHDVPFSQFATDLTNGTVPNFAWITPNMCNDMHDCSIGSGDAWLQQQVPAILASSAYTSQNSLLMITWDEDDDTGGANQVATLVIAKSVPAGYTSSASYTHYSLLKTVEQAWGLSALTANDANASPMADFFTGAKATATATATASATATPSATATATPTATAGAARLGYAAVGQQTDSGNANYLNGSRFTAAGGGTVTSMSVYLGAADAAPHNHYQLAIYADDGGAPGALVARSATGTVAPNAWNTLPLSAALTANTAYWLMYNTDASAAALNEMRYDASGGVPYAYSSASVPFGAWPAAFGPADVYAAAYSIYATYTP